MSGKIETLSVEELRALIGFLFKKGYMKALENAGIDPAESTILDYEFEQMAHDEIFEMRKKGVVKRIKG